MSLKTIQIVINWIDWFIKGYSKAKRDKRHEEIKANPRDSFKSKFGGLPDNDSADLQGGEAGSDVQRDRKRDSD